MAKTVRVGFVGTGGIATGFHMKELAKVKDVEFAAMTDVNRKRAKAAADQYGGKVYNTHYELFEKAEIDALYVCLPPSAHSDAEIIAAGKGIHLYVEKPIVLDMEKGLEVARAIQKAGIISAVGYQLRYTPGVQAVKKFLADRQVAMVSANRFGGIAGGPDHWWRVMSVSGGMFHEQATHGMDFIRYVVGEVATVYARYSLTVLKGVENLTIPDSQEVMLEFVNGAVGHYSSCCALTTGGGWSNTDFILKDMAVRHSWGGVEIVPKEAGKIELPKEGPGADASFIEAIRTGNRSLVKSDYFDGLKTTEVTLAANESAQTGRPVALRLAWWK